MVHKGYQHAVVRHQKGKDGFTLVVIQSSQQTWMFGFHSPLFGEILDSQSQVVLAIRVGILIANGTTRCM